jgi:hypothetical protein
VVRAQVRQGSREDALRFAVDLAAAERGMPKDQVLGYAASMPCCRVG